MGHRTNYVIREEGKLTLFYSHWGALTVPEDVFWGPGYAETFIRSNEQVGPDDWLDNVWGEGGVALDKDERTIALFGGEALGLPPLRGHFARLMQALWGQQGWTVRFVDGMPDIAEQVGVDRAICEADPVDPIPADLEALGHAFREEGFFCALVSVRQERPDRQAWSDRVLDVGASYALVNGPSVVPALDRLPTLDEARRAHAERPLLEWEERRGPMAARFSAAVLIDATARRLCFWEGWAREHDISVIRLLWAAEGWQVESHEGGLAEHFARTSRPLPDDLTLPDAAQEEGPVDLGEVEALEQIGQHLFGDRSDPTELVRRVLADESKGSEVAVNPSALVSPPDGRPDRHTCIRLFTRAIQGLRASAAPC
jgi:hypothetical protein